MKISLNWLSDYVELPENPNELIEVLPMLGLEVEENEEESDLELDQVVVGEVLTKEVHPEADRLSVCTVNVGSKLPASIVCGATNFKPGDRVPVALPGAQLPGGFKIKKSKLRGVTSEGMMCSSKELNIGDDDQGLFILPDQPEIGTPINQLFSRDKVLELEITANRGDCLSYLGVAREVAARYQKQLSPPPVSSLGNSTTECPADFLVDKVILESKDCSRYCLWSIRDVKIAPSPDWLKQRLESVGLRPINNIVDITNYVLLETGQPLHAFDAEKISQRTIHIREANEGESITTLDGCERKLSQGMMVIADAENPLVIAGVMGSVDAEVEDSTTQIVLESAWFKPGKVRSASRKLGLHTDSSQRFSRDVDPLGLERAAQRAIDLILELAGGTCLPSYVSLGETPRQDRTIDILHSYVEKIVGFPVDAASVVGAWERLGFSVEGCDPWTVSIPSFRSEVSRPIDLVEEFLRIYGTSELQNVAVSQRATLREDDSTYQLCQRAIDNLIGQGFQEVCNYSLRASEEVQAWHPDLEISQISLNNPLTSDHTHVRASLLPGLADNLAYNQKNLNNLTRIFETGRVFRPSSRGNLELLSVATALLPKPNSRQWKNQEEFDFFELKSQAIRLLQATGLKLPHQNWEVCKGSLPWQSEYAAKIGSYSQNKLEVTIGILDLSLSKQKEVKGPVYSIELLIDPILLRKNKKPASFTSYSSFPPAIKDLSLVAEIDEPAESIRLTLEKIALEVAKGDFEVDPVSIFDVFQGKGLEEGKKSISCSMRFRASDRTLSEKEVNLAFDSIVQKIENHTPYHLRK